MKWERRFTILDLDWRVLSSFFSERGAEFRRFGKEQRAYNSFDK